MELFDGIIINYSKYKDSDIIFNVLTKDSFKSILARGGDKPNNKANKFKKPFLYGQFDVYQGNTNGLKFRDCKIYKNYLNNFSTLEDSSILDFLSEITFKLLIQTDEYVGYFELINNILKEYDSNKSTKYSLIIYYFANLLKLNGIQLNLESCIECNTKKDICGIDYINGGLVCLDHKTHTTKNINLEELNLLKLFFSSNIENINKISLDWDYFKTMLINFSLLLENSLNLKLKSIEFIKSI